VSFVRMVRIVAIGDIMLGGILSGVGTGFVSQKVLGALNGADIRVGYIGNGDWK